MQALDAARRRQRVAREPGEEGELARAEPGSVLLPRRSSEASAAAAVGRATARSLAGLLRYSTFMHRDVPGRRRCLRSSPLSPHAEPAECRHGCGGRRAASHTWRLPASSANTRNKIAHVLDGDADVQPPRSLTPFSTGVSIGIPQSTATGCSRRLVREYPDAEFAAPARAALAISFTEGKVAQEVAYLQGDGRVSFERPYARSPGSCNSRRNCAAGMTRDAQRWAKVLQRAGGREPRTGSAPGCRSFTIRSASASIRRLHLPSASFATGRSCPGDTADARPDRRAQPQLLHLAASVNCPLAYAGRPARTPLALPRRKRT